MLHLPTPNPRLLRRLSYKQNLSQEFRETAGSRVSVATSHLPAGFQDGSKARIPADGAWVCVDMASGEWWRAGARATAGNDRALHAADMARWERAAGTGAFLDKPLGGVDPVLSRSNGWTGRSYVESGGVVCQRRPDVLLCAGPWHIPALLAGDGSPESQGTGVMFLHAVLGPLEMRSPSCWDALLRMRARADHAGLLKQAWRQRPTYVGSRRDRLLDRCARRPEAADHGSRLGPWPRWS